jgi:hypothetical protein
MTGMLKLRNSAAGPIPLSLSICGELYDPPAIMTSREATAEPGVPAPALPASLLARYKYLPSKKSTPVAVGVPDELSKFTLVTKQLVRTSRGYALAPRSVLASRTWTTKSLDPFRFLFLVAMGIW